MILHQAIKYLVNNYGCDILLNKRMFNLMCDFQLFRYEDSSMTSTFEIIIQRYGEDLYEGLINGEWSAMYNRCILDCTHRYGFKEDIISYIFESIAYGLGKISKISPNYVINWGNRNIRWESYMVFYQLCGFNLLPIKGNIDNWWDEEEKSFKNPSSGVWTDFISADFNKDIIDEVLSDDSYTGIGGIVGGNSNIRVLDFDDLGIFAREVNGPWNEESTKFSEFVNYCLKRLGLPEDYQWVVKSGSGCGFHIIFKTSDINNFSPEIISFQSHKDLRKEKLDVKSLDLIWNGYVALPPTVGAGAFNPNLYDTYPFIYRFFKRNIFPDYEPYVVTIGNLNSFLIDYCSDNHFYGGWVDGITLYGNVKKSSEFGSFSNDYLSYNDSLEWLQNCDTPEGQNMYAIKLIEQKEFDKAAITLSKVLPFSFAAYNYAVLMSLGKVPHSNITLHRIRPFFEQDSRISKYDIEQLHNRLENIKLS